MDVNCIGIGIVTSNANNCKEFYSSLYNQKTGIRLISGFDCEKYKTNTCAEIRGYDYKTKYLYIAEKALEEALCNAGLTIKEIQNNSRVGLVLGTSLGNTVNYEEYYKNIVLDTGKNVDTSILSKGMIHYLSNMLCRKLMIKGLVFTVSNTCVSGINAIEIGTQMIRNNKIDICIVGGIEIISEFIYGGLSSLNALSSKSGLDIFSNNPDGMIVGEGAGFLVLAGEEYEGYCKKYGKIVSYSVTNDCMHITAPDKEGNGLISAIYQSLNRAGLSEGDIDVVLCCGTGTKYNDAMQIKAIKAIWANAKEVIITSIKRLLLHQLSG